MEKVKEHLQNLQRCDVSQLQWDWTGQTVIVEPAILTQALKKIINFFLVKCKSKDEVSQHTGIATLKASPM